MGVFSDFALFLFGHLRQVSVGGPLQKKVQTTTLPERITKINIDAAVALPPVGTVHFNLEVTIVSSTCCKSTDGKNL